MRISDWSSDVCSSDLEEVEQSLHVGVVVLLRHRTDARPRALLDVEQQAGPTEALVGAELAVGAGAQGEGAQEQVEGLADGVGVAVGPADTNALALPAPHPPRAGPLVIPPAREEGAALVIPAAGD